MPTTAAMMTRDNFGNLLTPVHKKIFFESYNEVPSVYKKLFKVEKMNAKNQSYPHLGALGLWAENTEGSKFNHDKFDEGPVASFEAKRFDKAYELTWELVQDDLYNVMKGIGKGGSARALGRGLRATEETETANILANGFSNTGYDGRALFAEDHPLINSDVTCSNLIKGTLTDENLKKAMTLMRQQKDEAGIVISASAKRLIVSPEMEFTAKAIVHSILQSGTNYNDVNTIPNLEIVVWDFLTGPAWFIQDPSFDNLLFLRREEPIFDSERIQKKMDYRMFGYTRFDVGYCDWRGLVGSTGERETVVVPGGDTGDDENPDDETGDTPITFDIQQGSSEGFIQISNVNAKGYGNLKYKILTSADDPDAKHVGFSSETYDPLTENADILGENGSYIHIVETDSFGDRIVNESAITEITV